MSERLLVFSGRPLPLVRHVQPPVGEAACAGRTLEQPRSQCRYRLLLIVCLRRLLQLHPRGQDHEAILSDQPHLPGRSSDGGGEGRRIGPLPPRTRHARHCQRLPRHDVYDRLQGLAKEMG